MANDDEKAVLDPTSDSSADTGDTVTCEESGSHFARQALSGDARLSGCGVEVTATNATEPAAPAASSNSGYKDEIAQKLEGISTATG